MDTVVDEEALTVAEAAKLIKVSTSTLWRWINSGQLPAYRLGHRQVRIRKADIVTRLITARPPKAEGGSMKRNERTDVKPRLSVQEQERGLVALESARRLQERLRTRLGEKDYPSSTELINEARDARTRPLA